METKRNYSCDDGPFNERNINGKKEDRVLSLGCRPEEEPFNKYIRVHGMCLKREMNRETLMRFDLLSPIIRVLSSGFIWGFGKFFG